MALEPCLDTNRILQDLRRGKPRLYQQAKPEMETDIVRTSVVPPGLVPILELDPSAEALGYFRDTPLGLFLRARSGGDPPEAAEKVETLTSAAEAAIKTKCL